MVYSESEGKPQIWDQSQKGTVKINKGPFAYLFKDNNYDYTSGMKFIQKMGPHQFVQLSLVEYVFVSTSLALVIAKFFPAVHNQIVSRATRLEHQSLYWGTAVVSNVFTYGLLYAVMRWGSISFLVSYVMDLVSYKSISPYVPLVQEVAIKVILFVGAVIASLKTHHDTNVPIPRGMANIIINLSFCWSCFCCCVCCSPQCRAKTMRVLVLFSFMSFVYHNVMDVISVLFLMFIEENRVTTVTLTLLYISLLVFLVLFVSFSLLSLLRSRNDGVLRYRNFITCFGGLCMFMIVFPAIVLMVLMYTIVIISLNLRGVTGIVTGLIPSIALSAVSWYIRKKLLKRAAGQSSNTSDQDQPANVTNKEEREDERMLLP